MQKLIIVSNTTPFSELAKVEKMNVIKDVFGKIIIHQEVYTELTTGNHPAVAQIKSANWVEVRTISNILKQVN